MKMPPLDFEKLTAWRIKLCDISGEEAIVLCSQLVDDFLNKLSTEHKVAMVLLGIKNPEAFTTIIATYMTIRDAMIDQEVKDLENLVK